jgi:hypothetical protein
MKFGCECGSTIYDIADGHADKARWLPDKDWDSFIGAIGELSRLKNASDYEREKSVIDLLTNFRFMSMYQCSNCGSMFIDKKGSNQLNTFKPISTDIKKDLLSGN